MKHKRNKDRGWGWVQWSSGCKHPARNVFTDNNISFIDDGTCDEDGIYELAKKFPLKSKIGGKIRGCLPVVVDEYGVIRQYTSANN